MHLSDRAKNMAESVTLLLNSKAVRLSEEGRTIFNLTAGQLPFKPMDEFVGLIKEKTSDLKSFQYCPVLGFENLRKKCIANIERTRGINFKEYGIDVDCIVSNGAKHSLTNILATIINPKDEVLMLAPYWISYSEIISLWGGKPIVIDSNVQNSFEPMISDIQKAITHKTKAIIVNSPNNPSGTHYSAEWMQKFAELMMKHPEISIISDEIYYELHYDGDKPRYYYQFQPELLKRTIIIDGISKTLASTGLRIGYAIGPKKIIAMIGKIQGQTASGANSLIQKALADLDLSKTDDFLAPIKVHLKKNATTVREKFTKKGMIDGLYWPKSAFYYMIDLKSTPIYHRYCQKYSTLSDHAVIMCEDILEQIGVAMVPGSDFGLPNSARISLVLKGEDFTEAMNRLVEFLSQD